MMHVNVRKLKQLHVKVGSMDFPGGVIKFYENLFNISIMQIIDI